MSKTHETFKIKKNEHPYKGKETNETTREFAEISSDEYFKFRLTYIGCDIIDLPNLPINNHLLCHPAINGSQTSGQVLVKLADKFYYVNRIVGIVEEIFDVKDYFKNAPRTLNLKEIEQIAIGAKIPELYKQAKHVTNIEIELTGEERRQVLCKLADNNINFKNSAYTYVLQGFIAKYMGESEHELHALHRKVNSKTKGMFSFLHKKEHELKKITKMRDLAKKLHKLSADFIALEHYVNNAIGEPKLKLEEFANTLENSITNILNYLDTIIEYKDSNQYIFKELKQNLKDNYDNFKKQIEKLKINPNKQDLDCLFSVGDRALFIKSLGTFMREEMSLILDYGIKAAYKISNNRLRDVIQVPRLVTYLSDAKHILLIKGQSVVEGPKDNDTYAPMPKAMLNSLTGIEAISCEEKKYFSLNPYLKSNHPKYLDDVICLISGKSRDDNNFYGNYFYHFLLQPLKLFASIFEIAFSIPRLIMVTALGTIEAILSPFSSKPNSKKITWKINQYINKLYDKFALIFAPLTYLNNIEANRYKRTEITEVEIDEHQKILDNCADYSSYCHKLFGFFTTRLVSNSIHEFFISIASSITNFFTDLKYLFEPLTNNQDVFNKVTERYESLKLLSEVFGIENISGLKFEKNADDSYDPVTYCDNNDIKTPLDVFYEIAVVISNDVVNPMFRKSPGIATFYFALSMLTFGTLTLPAATFAWMKPLPGWLQYLANKISLNFTGKPVSAGIMEQSIACFLGWKLGFFSTELAVEMLEGHYEILEKLFEEPEKIVLGLAGFVGLGMGIKYIPELPSTIKIRGLFEIPNPYFIIINTFSEEAKSCADGTIGLTSIEYGFLGLKFAMLMHSMLSNSESEDKELTELEKLVLVLQQNGFFNSLLKYCKDKGIMAENLQQSENYFESFIKSELIRINLIFSDECVKNLAKLFVNPNKTKFTKPETNTKPTLDEAHKSLYNAIKMIEDKNHNLILNQSILGLNKEANKLYDKLDSLFDEYNAALKREKPTKYNNCFIDKRPYLDIFFNKYIYKRSNNFVRSLLLIFYPISIVSRALKYAWATLNHKPSMQHQVIKNFCKDFVILSQVFTPIARIFADFNLYLSGTLRGIAFIVVTPLAVLLYPLVQLKKYLTDHNNYTREPFSNWLVIIDKNICKYIALHKTPALQPIRQLIVRAARVAGVSTNLEAVSDKVLYELDYWNSSKENASSYDKIMPILNTQNQEINTSPEKLNTEPPNLTLLKEATLINTSTVNTQTSNPDSAPIYSP